ncbi:hypothetical protein FGB62_183g09 [Gracilaria domingensis]|nr:hypothetical protein FGB62_183g09 [Gracilaria domingensis]
MRKPSRKTLIDRYKRFISARREQNKVNEEASGIAQRRSRARNQKLEAYRSSINDQEKALHGSSQLKRNYENQSIASQPSSKKSGQSERPQSDEALTKVIMEQSVEKDKREKQRFTLERERLELEQTRAAREFERHEALKLETERRIDLDEERFVLEREERKQAMEERKHLLNIMAALSVNDVHNIWAISIIFGTTQRSVLLKHR